MSRTVVDFPPGEIVDFIRFRGGSVKPHLVHFYRHQHAISGAPA